MLNSFFQQRYFTVFLFFQKYNFFERKNPLPFLLLFGFFLSNSQNFLFGQSELIALENKYDKLLKKGRIDEAAQLAFQLGNAYNDYGTVETATYYFDRAADNFRKVNKLPQAAAAYSAGGDVKFEERSFLVAISLYNRSLKLYRETNDKKNYAKVLIKIGKSLIEARRYKKAIVTLKSARTLGEEIDDDEVQKLSYNLLAISYEHLGDKVEALKYYKSYSDATNKDSESYINKIEKEKTVSEKELISTTKELSKKAILLKLKEEELKNVAIEKKAIEIQNHLQELKIDSLDKSQKIKALQIQQQEERLSSQQLIRNISIAGAVIFLAFLVALFKNFRNKQEDNKQLAFQNKKILLQQEQLVDSIRYAGEIQTAILPSERMLLEYFSDSFVIYKPRDIVSGDFYWFADFPNFFIIVVADCTGHGVPGALLSMIGSTLLNEIIKENKIHEPSEILKHLHLGIRAALKQEQEQNLESIELGLCRIEKDKNEENTTTKVTFAGAKRPLYIGEKEKFYEQKADRKAIGGRQREEKRLFSNNEILLPKGTMIWLTTDGFADQANLQNQKIGSRKLKMLLTEIQDKSAAAQKRHLSEYLQKHQESQIQIDDIALIGIRV